MKSGQNYCLPALSSELELATVLTSGTDSVSDLGPGPHGMRLERFTRSIWRWDMSVLSSYSAERNHGSRASPRSWGPTHLLDVQEHDAWLEIPVIAVKSTVPSG